MCLCVHACVCVSAGNIIIHNIIVITIATINKDEAAGTTRLC